MGAILDGDDERLELLRRTRSIAIVGMSGDPRRASHGVAAYLRDHAGYELLFVNPNETEILGRPVVPTLGDLPSTPDMVDVFRRTEHLPGVTEEAIEVGASSIWFQLGLEHEGAASAAVDAGLDVVQNRCIKIEHARFRHALD